MPKSICQDEALHDSVKIKPDVLVELCFSESISCSISQLLSQSVDTKYFKSLQPNERI